ncbi:MAG: hypothetical protein M5U34_08560 [Chloroflexi bacterium]|nr:hypothetical protein [Chloroflexota bacterium]
MADAELLRLLENGRLEVEGLLRGVLTIPSWCRFAGMKKLFRLYINRAGGNGRYGIFQKGRYAPENGPLL